MQNCKINKQRNEEIIYYIYNIHNIHNIYTILINRIEQIILKNFFVKKNCVFCLIIIMNTFIIKKRVNFFPTENRLIVNQTPTLLIDPPNIVFDNYEISKQYINKLNVKNMSNFKMNLTVKPLSNPQFQFKMDPKGSLLEGESIQIYVFFKPTEVKDYEQRLEIQYQNEIETVLIRAKPTKIIRKNSVNHMLMSYRRTSKRFKPNTRFGQESPISNSSIQPFSVELIASNDFMRKFHEIELFNKEKDLRNQTYLGKRALSPSSIQNLKNQRRNKQLIRLNEFQNKITNRFRLQFPSECPIADKADIKVVQWDQMKNDYTKIRENGIRKLHECIRKQIMNIRFQKAYRIWNKYLQLKPKMDKPSLFRLIEEQNTKSQRSKNQKPEVEIYFSKNYVIRKSLALQFDGSLQCPNTFQFQINPRIGFDDQIPIEELPENDQEIMGYQNIEWSPLQNFSNLVKFTPRTGNEFEYAVMSEIMNDPLPETFNFTNQQQQQSQSQLPINASKTSSSSFIIEEFNITQPYFRNNLIVIQEYKPDQKEDKLSFHNMDIQEKNNMMIPNADIQNNFALGKSIDLINFELFHYLIDTNKTVSTRWDCGFYENIEKQCDRFIGSFQPDDKLNEEIVLNDVQIRSDWRKELQEGEEEIVPEIYDQDIIIQNLDRGLSNLKQQNLLIFHSRLESINKFIKDRKYKFIF